MGESKEIVVRHSTPTNLESAEFGTITKVFNDDSVEIYVQLGSIEAPNWQKIGHLFEAVFKSAIENPKFMENILEFYKINNPM